MKVSPVLVTVALMATTVGACYFLLQQCSETKTEKAKSDTLRKEKAVLVEKVSALRDTNNLLVKLIYKKDGIISAGRLTAAETRDKLNQAIKEKKIANAKLTDAEVKLAASEKAFKNGDISDQQFKDVLNGLPLFATPEEANRKYLDMVDERNMWRDSTQAVFEQLGQLKQEKSDLELDLNDERLKRLAIRDSIASVRSYVQNTRQEKSKGLVRKIINAGQIKTLGKVDDRLNKIK